jgi:hypothetical protein
MSTTQAQLTAAEEQEQDRLETQQDEADPTSAVAARPLTAAQRERLNNLKRKGQAAKATPLPKGKAVAAAPKAGRTPKPPRQLHPCLCGCGEQVGGRFRMGHDGRYYGWMKRIVGGKTPKEVGASSSVTRALGPDFRRAAAKVLKESGH